MNLYKQFLDLLPKTPLLVGEVVAYSNGVALIQEPGGGRQHARGTAEVGDNVFFRDGVIHGPAPDLTDVQIEV
jgi:hypothetical protein